MIEQLFTECFASDGCMILKKAFFQVYLNLAFYVHFFLQMA